MDNPSNFLETTAVLTDPCLQTSEVSIVQIVAYLLF